MARMYSRKKGKSGSKKPIKRIKKVWVRYNAKEVEQLIVKLAKAGHAPSQIGLILRDSYGVPDIKIITTNNILEILKKNNLSPDLPEDLTALIKKQVEITKHLENNKKDMSSKRGLILTESKISRLVKYYKRKGILPDNWKYDKQKARLLIG